MSGKITWGCELEFAVPDSIHDISSGDSGRCHEAALRALAVYLSGNTSLPIACDCLCADDTGTSLVCQPPVWHRDSDLAIYSTPRVDSGFDVEDAAKYYILQCDSVVPPGINGWRSLEIATAVRGAEEIQQSLPEMRELLRALGQMDSGISITDLAGFHIHVGENLEGITLLLAKRVLTLVTLLEDSLFTKLVTTVRKQSTWFEPVNTHSSFAMDSNKANMDQVPDLAGILPAGYHSGEFWAKNGSQLGRLLERIWASPGLVRLASGLMDADDIYRRSFALKLRFVEGSDYERDEADVCPKWCSFELRYPGASFDLDFLSLWIELSCTIVSIARQTDDGTYDRILGNIMATLNHGQADTGASELLRALGFDAGKVDRWMQVVAAHEAGNDPSVVKVGSGTFRQLRTPGP